MHEEMEDVRSLVSALEEIVVPLLVVDNATVYVVSATTSEVHLHLGGAYSGCPACPFVERSLLGPVVASVLPKASLRVTSGSPIPNGARLVTSKRGSA